MSQTAVIGRAAECFVIEGGRPLQGITLPPGDVPGMIDELPLLAVVAARASAQPVVLIRSWTRL